MMETNLYGAQGRVICDDDSSDNGSLEIGDEGFIIEFGMCVRAMRVSCKGPARREHCGYFLNGLLGKKYQAGLLWFIYRLRSQGSSALGGSVELGWTRADTARTFQYKICVGKFSEPRNKIPQNILPQWD